MKTSLPRRTLLAHGAWILFPILFLLFLWWDSWSYRSGITLLPGETRSTISIESRESELLGELSWSTSTWVLLNDGWQMSLTREPIVTPSGRAPRFTWYPDPGPISTIRGYEGTAPHWAAFALWGVLAGSIVSGVAARRTLRRRREIQPPSDSSGAGESSLV